VCRVLLYFCGKGDFHDHNFIVFASSYHNFIVCGFLVPYLYRLRVSRIITLSFLVTLSRDIRYRYLSMYVFGVRSTRPDRSFPILVPSPLQCILIVHRISGWSSPFPYLRISREYGKSYFLLFLLLKSMIGVDGIRYLAMYGIVRWTSWASYSLSLDVQYREHRRTVSVFDRSDTRRR